MPIDTISTFIIDYCALLGVTKKLILLWVSSKGRQPYKMSTHQIQRINENIYSIKKTIPLNYFARIPRRLYEVDRWKATEFRLFVLYIGKIVVHNVISDCYRNHFLILNTALCLLLLDNINNPENIDLAYKLFQYFLIEGIKLYGDVFAVYNVHSVLHLAKDAYIYGSLDIFSVFKFENYLQ